MKSDFLGIGVLATVILGFIVLGMWGCPQYKVYSARKDGESQLAHAQSSKEVKVAEAKANMESAAYNAQADTIRAHGIARAISIVGEKLKGQQEYLHWLWIDNIEKNPNAVIYVPTEANLPIMEAGMRTNNINSILSSKIDSLKNLKNGN